MGADQNYDWALATASALEWWRDAGVDTLIDDAPRDWLAPPAPLPVSAHVSAPTAQSLPASAPPLTAPAATAGALPATLAAFREWRAAADMPDAAWSGATIAADGPDAADLMVLADCPDTDDDGTLLAGGCGGRLFARMLAAIGVDRAAVHVAAVCLRRPVAMRVPRESEAYLGELARHHVSLVAPKRLLLLGNAASRAILALDLHDARGDIRVVNHAGGTVHAVASYHPRFLIERPACKAESWKDLRMLMRDLET